MHSLASLSCKLASERDTGSPGQTALALKRRSLVCAIDGTVMTVGDSAANLRELTKQSGGSVASRPSHAADSQERSIA
jgi:hypothetical protein